MASEKKQRLLSKELISVEVVAEAAPFTFSLKGGGEEVKASGIAYISYLADKIFELLDQHSRYQVWTYKGWLVMTDIYSNDSLTWHNGVIPEDEIWIKIGGDKGGGSFKMNFQICNVESPNSKTNTCTFCAFLAYDSVTNLHTALDRYSDQVNDLQTMKWRYICNENT